MRESKNVLTETIAHENPFLLNSCPWFSEEAFLCEVGFLQNNQFPMFVMSSVISLFVFQVCAIVGGTFTVAGIIDSIIFTASELFKKAQLGKLS